LRVISNSPSFENPKQTNLGPVWVSSQFFGVAQSLMKFYHGVNEIETRGGYDGALIACFHE